jgi:hypothetical protein
MDDLLYFFIKSLQSIHPFNFTIFLSMMYQSIVIQSPILEI